MEFAPMTLTPGYYTVFHEADDKESLAILLRALGPSHRVFIQPWADKLFDTVVE